MLVGISIEQIEYADPPRIDGQRPFEPLQAGDAVFVRVRALRLGEPPLGRGQARIGVSVPARASVAIAGRRGVGGCQRIAAVLVSCPITIKLRDEDEASVLLRIEIPPGLEGATLRIVANVGPVPDSGIRIAAKAQSVKVALAPSSAAPWSGTWTWHARWSTGSFDGTGMTIAQEGDTVCARWPWSPPDGHAEGSVSGSTWMARWTDGFGSGSWTLTLSADGSGFTGTQEVTPHPGNGAPFTARIEGTRTSSGTASLDCDAVPTP